MPLVLFIHLIAIGIWAGCVATEIVCEIGQKNMAYKQSYIAKLHWEIDKYVEIPAILVCTITGVIMLQNVIWSPILITKVAAGVLAVLFNSIAAYTVYMRYHYFTKDNESGYIKYHKLHERIGIVCVLAIVVALVAGGFRIVGS